MVCLNALPEAPTLVSSLENFAVMRDSIEESVRHFGVVEDLSPLYKVDVSPSLISAITSEVVDDMKAWQNRPLNAVYPIVYLDCLHIKVRDSGVCENKAVYLALGVNIEGNKELLGLWMSANEGAKFWLSVMAELQQRGVQDIFIACVDGLKGFSEAIESVFPETDIQLCIVHMVRNSLRFVSWKQRKEVATDLKEIYKAPTVQAASDALNSPLKKSLFPCVASHQLIDAAKHI